MSWQVEGEAAGFWAPTQTPEEAMAWLTKLIAKYRDYGANLTRGLIVAPETRDRLLQAFAAEQRYTNFTRTDGQEFGVAFQGIPIFAHKDVMVGEAVLRRREDIA